MMVPDSSHYAPQQRSGGIHWACLMQPCGFAALMPRMLVPMSVAELHISHVGTAGPALLSLCSALKHRQRPMLTYGVLQPAQRDFCQMQDGGPLRFRSRCWGVPTVV